MGASPFAKNEILWLRAQNDTVTVLTRERGSHWPGL